MLDTKRGQGLSTNTLILIILGVVILVLLIGGFTIGWNKVLPFIPTNNVDSIEDSCSVACATDSKYNYCTAPRDLKLEDKEISGATCYYIANGMPEVGVETCPSISCDVALISDATNEQSAQGDVLCSEEGNAGKDIYYLEDDTLKTTTCPGVTEETQ